MGAHATVKHFKDKYGENDLSVIAIGQAGENKVKYASWMNENDRSAGRGGTGAVGGAKHLKAIVVKSGRESPRRRPTPRPGRPSGGRRSRPSWTRRT